MVPQHNNPLTTVPKLRVYPTRTYKHRDTPRLSERQPYESRITTHIDGLEAMEQAVRHILATQRRVSRYERGVLVHHGYVIYPTWYGTDFARYHDRDFGYFRATIKQELTDSLTTDDRITGVTINRIQKLDIDAALVDFTVHTNIGNIGMRVEVSLTA